MTDRRRTPANTPTPSGPDHDLRLTPGLETAIIQAQQGDEHAFRHLYQTVQPRLLAYARTLVGETDAEDITAEAWACIARDLHKFTGDGQGFLGWSVTITRHRATDHLRRRRPVTLLPNEHLPEHTSPNDTSTQAEETFATTAALAMIGRLPTDQAQAILLRVVMGLDTATTARILDKRTGAVRIAAHRGLKTLARHLDHHRPQAAPQHVGDPNTETASPHTPTRQATTRPARPKPAEC